MTGVTGTDTGAKCGCAGAGAGGCRCRCRWVQVQVLVHCHVVLATETVGYFVRILVNEPRACRRRRRAAGLRGERPAADRARALEAIFSARSFAFASCKVFLAAAFAASASCFASFLRSELIASRSPWCTRRGRRVRCTSRGTSSSRIRPGTCTRAAPFPESWRTIKGRGVRRSMSGPRGAQGLRGLADALRAAI